MERTPAEGDQKEQEWSTRRETTIGPAPSHSLDLRLTA